MNDENKMQGIHHITAICSAPAENVAFYEEVLGLRLVKQTVNFDDPYTYHLYYGDQAGNPGTILTFFPWEKAGRGANGAGMIVGTAFEIPSEAIPYWLDRLAGSGLQTAREKRFGNEVLVFSDPHGLTVELVAAGGEGQGSPGIRGLYGATALVRSQEGTGMLLEKTLGFTAVGREGNRHRYMMENSDSRALVYDLLVDPEAVEGRQGTGTVHHIAFRTGSDEQQLKWRQKLAFDGYPVTTVRDRNYFKSIYFNEPGGVLFEIATDLPGFAIDESAEELGRSLQLPSQYEPMRGRIEQSLPVLRRDDVADQWGASS